MKVLIALPLLSISLTSIPKSVENQKPTFYISPVHLSKQSTFVVESHSSSLNFTIYLDNDNRHDVPIVSDSLNEPGRYIYKYDNRYTRKNNQIKVVYNYGSGEITSPYIARNIEKGKTKYIENNESIISESTYAILDENLSWNLKKAEYSFENFSGLYVPDFYHKIDLSSFKILVDELERPFFTQESRLNIYNVNGVFDDIEGAGELVTFNIDFDEVDDGFVPKLKDPLYVDRTTLLMSSTPKEGYVQTRHIYLPINAMDLQSEYNSYFFFGSFGLDQTSVFYRFEIKALLNTFGDCFNSEYCIVRLN